MIRCRFKLPVEDPRPVHWPLKHPYWISGEGEDFGEEFFILIAYADDEAEILTNWPEAVDLDSVGRADYTFTTRFPKPSWFDGGAPR